jgi:hypothetical protein
MVNNMGAIIWYGSIVLAIIGAGLLIWGIVVLCKNGSNRKWYLVLGILFSVSCFLMVLTTFVLGFTFNTGAFGIQFIISCLMFWQYGKIKRKGVNNDKGNTK